MEQPPPTNPMIDRDSDITATVLRERTRLGNFIRRRVRDPSDAEDILQDVLHEFVQAYRLPEPIEQVSAWLFRVARNRIIDRFRKKREQPLSETADRRAVDDEYRLDLALPHTMPGRRPPMPGRCCSMPCRPRSTNCRPTSATFLSRTKSRAAASRNWLAESGVSAEHAARTQALCGAASARPLANRL
jgi:RNA polymerase sigma factor (sigma-70 family)